MDIVQHDRVQSTTSTTRITLCAPRCLITFVISADDCCMLCLAGARVLSAGPNDRDRRAGTSSSLPAGAHARVHDYRHKLTFAAEERTSFYC